VAFFVSEGFEGRLRRVFAGPVLRSGFRVSANDQRPTLGKSGLRFFPAARREVRGVALAQEVELRDCLSDAAQVNGLSEAAALLKGPRESGGRRRMKAELRHTRVRDMGRQAGCARPCLRPGTLITSNCAISPKFTPDP
jgi:hypothetical protein